MSVLTIKKNNTYTVDDLYQWDTNRELVIQGLKFLSLPEIHFANGRMSKAIVKQATSYDNDVIKVMIPNVLLETAIPIRVFICTRDGDEFVSRYSLTINVKERPKPEDYIADNDEKIYSYNALENLVNDTVINLRSELEDFKSAMHEETREIINTTTIADADTVDGYHAEDFVLASKPGRTVFNSDGSITTTYNDGSSEKVVFNSDGSITTTYNTLELGVKTETIKFNADGSISVEVSEEVKE